MTINDFILKHGLTSSRIPVFENPWMNDEKWEANHYQFCIKYQGRHMTTYFSQGIGIKSPPKLADVLNCLILDADVRHYSFEEWADNFGYDVDSRQAERTYNLCQKQNDRLLNLFKNRAIYNELMECETL